MSRRCLMSLLVGLLWGCLISRATAETLVCPYETVKEGPRNYSRALALVRNTILPLLRVETGLVDPWSYEHGLSELEVQGDRALLNLDLGVLSPALQSLIVSPGVGGCTVVLPEALGDVKKAARVPKVNADDTGLEFDHTDPTLPIINPHAYQVSWRLPPWRQLVAWVLPRAAHALGTFPDVQVTDNFTRANETPLAAPWLLVTTAQQNFNLASNQITCPVAECLQYYNKLQPADADVAVTLTTATAGSMLPCLRGREMGGANTVDGYCTQARTTNEDVGTIRLDSGVITLLSTRTLQTVSSGHKAGIRATGTSLDAYYFVSGWVLLHTRTDSTYGGAGYAWLHGNDTSHVFDDFQMTAQQARKRPVWFP